MKVPFNYLPFQFSKVGPYFSEWKKLIKSTEFTLGKYVEEFEKILQNILVLNIVYQQNGTDALILSLKALNIKGDEVITVCNSFYATTGAIVMWCKTSLCRL